MMNVYLRFTKLKNLKNTVHISIIIVSGLAFLFNAKYLSASAAFLACVSIVLDLCLSRRIRKDFDHLYRMAYFDSLTGIPSRLAQTVGHTATTLWSYGGTLTFDMRLVRMPKNDTSIGVYVYKPSDRKGVVSGFILTLPL